MISSRRARRRERSTGSGNPGATWASETKPKSPVPVLTKKSQKSPTARYRPPAHSSSRTKCSRFCGSRTTKNVPSNVPAIVPAPPMRMMAMNSTDEDEVPVLRWQAADEGGEHGTGEAGEERRDGEGDQLVLELRHAHDLGGDVAVADRLQGPPGAGAHEVLGDEDRHASRASANR